MTKYILTFFLFVGLTINAAFCQDKKTNSTSQISSKDLTIHVDSLKVKNVVDSVKVQILQNTNNKASDNPWIVALIVGILTVLATILVSFINRKTTLNSVDMQTKASASVANNQINNSKEIAIEQIKNSQELALHSFNSTLKTQNRQEWVNDLRNTTSEFIANCALLNIEFQDPSKDFKERIKSLHEKITNTRTKILLLLHPNTAGHQELIDVLTEFVTILDEHVLNYKANILNYNNLKFRQASDKVVEVSRELLYKEWQKIQKLTE